VWDVETGKRLTRLRHSGAVTIIRFSSEGRRVLTASDDNTVRLWDAENGEPLTEPLRHGGRIRSAEFSPDGQRVLTVSVGDNALIWEVRTGQPLAIELRHPIGIRYARFSPDGKFALTVDFGSIARLWDPLSGELRTNTVHLSLYSLTSLEFSPDSRRFLTASGENQAVIWDLANGRRLNPPLQHPSTAPEGPSVFCAKFSSDGTRAATVSTDGTICIWDFVTGALLTNLIHGGYVNTLGFSPDGRQLVTACDARKAHVWDSTSGRHVGSCITRAQ
jgi:WD40 repeat protein